jgi:hypothetical protein
MPLADIGHQFLTGPYLIFRPRFPVVESFVLYTYAVGIWAHPRFGILILHVPHTRGR